MCGHTLLYELRTDLIECLHIMFVPDGFRTIWRICGILERVRNSILRVPSCSSICWDTRRSFRIFSLITDNSKTKVCRTYVTFFTRFFYLYRFLHWSVDMRLWITLYISPAAGRRSVPLYEMMFDKSIHTLTITFVPMDSQIKNRYISSLFVDYYRKTQK